MSADPNVFETANAGFAQVMYEEFLRDPNSVGPEWRQLFESGVVGVRPEEGTTATGRLDGQAVGGDSVRPAVVGNGAEAEPAPTNRLTVQPSDVAAVQPSEVAAVQPAEASAVQSAAAPSNATPISGPAARLVANMRESLSVPTATTFRELPVAVLEARRRELNNAIRSAGRSEKVS